ncbi:MAG: transcriptional regulator [Alphaproteobacteria bacterium]|nr:transcriptional regulator [Alphaproteobacteria bacterium]
MPTRDSHVVQGMKDAVAFARGNTTRGRIHIVARLGASDVVSIRMKTGLSPAEFARRYGFNLSSLRSWEARRHRPSGAAKTLLLVLQSAPRAVARALAAAQNLAA